MNGRTLPVVLLIIAAVALCPACGQREVSKYAAGLTGRVFADAPVKGATLKLYSSAGTLLYTKQNATDSNGRFWIDRHSDFTKRMRLEATGGEVVQLLTGKRIRAFDDRMISELLTEGRVQYVHVSTLTSVAARYWERNTKLELGAVENVVKEGMGIPAALVTQVPLSALDISPHFMGIMFVQAAFAANGGTTPMMIDNFAKKMAAEPELLIGVRGQENMGMIGDNPPCAKIEGLESGSWTPNAKEIGGLIKGIIYAASGNYAYAFVNIGGSLASYLKGGIFGNANPQLTQIQNSLDEIENQLCNVEASINNLATAIDAMFMKTWYSDAWREINGNAATAGAMWIASGWDYYNRLVTAAAKAPGPLDDQTISSYFTQFVGKKDDLSGCTINATLDSSIPQMANAAARAADMIAGGVNIPDQTYLNLVLKYYMWNDPYLGQAQSTQKLNYDEAQMQDAMVRLYSRLAQSYYYILDSAQKALMLETEWKNFCTAMVNKLSPLPGNDDYNKLLKILFDDPSANSIKNLVARFNLYMQPVSYEFMRNVAAIRSLDVNGWTASCCGSSPSWLSVSDIGTQAWEMFFLSQGASTSLVFELKIPWRDRPAFGASFFANHAGDFGVKVSPDKDVKYLQVWPFGQKDQTFLSPLGAASTALNAGEDNLQKGASGNLVLPLYLSGPKKDWGWSIQPYQPVVGYVAQLPDSLQGRQVTVSPSGGFDAGTGDGGTFYMQVPFFNNDPSATATVTVPGPGADGGTADGGAQESSFLVAAQSDPTLEGAMFQYVVQNMDYYAYYSHNPPNYYGFVNPSNVFLVSGISYEAGNRNPTAIYDALLSYTGLQVCKCGTGESTCKKCGTDTWGKGGVTAYISHCRAGDIQTAPVRAVHQNYSISPFSAGRLNINAYGSYNIMSDNFPWFYIHPWNNDSFSAADSMKPDAIKIQHFPLANQECTEPHRNCYNDYGPAWVVDHFMTLPGYPDKVQGFCNSH